MSAYKDLSGLFSITAIEIDEEENQTEHRATMNTSLEKVFNMENRYNHAHQHFLCIILRG